MAVVGLVVNPLHKEAKEECESLTTWLLAEGHEVHHLIAMAEPHRPSHFDLVVSLGGDGSILRAVSVMNAVGIVNGESRGLLYSSKAPVLGVNFGHLGYLTACEPGEVKEVIHQVLNGECTIEERMMLHVQVLDSNQEVKDEAHVLNDVVLKRGAGGDVLLGSTVQVGVTLDKSFFTSYSGDGLIVATPTGSTAYAFSARGPIVESTHRSIQITPISAHGLFDRTLLMSPLTEVCLEILENGKWHGVCYADGRGMMGGVQVGDQVVVKASDQVTQLVVPRDRHFTHVMKSKFGFEDR